VKRLATPDKELLPAWCFKLKQDIIMDVQQVWQFLEIDPFDVWQWRRFYLMSGFFVETCL
jgi:hypothetical protein